MLYALFFIGLFLGFASGWVLGVIHGIRTTIHQINEKLRSNSPQPTPPTNVVSIRKKGK